jgi:putative phosphotransacetylase
MAEKKIPVGISNRHLHLSQQDLETLFGKGYELTKKKDLVQPGQFACEETVKLVGPKREIDGLRIIGPVRPQTQVELALTDCISLGIKAPVRESGNIAGSAGAVIVGPQGQIELKEGVIVAARHIHMKPYEAEEFGVADGDIVKVKVEGERALIFDNVILRVGDKHKLDFHIDTDEANAAGLKNGDTVEIIKE